MYATVNYLLATYLQTKEGGGHKIKTVEKIRPGKARFHFEINAEEAEKIQMRFHESSCSEFESLRKQTIDLAYQQTIVVAQIYIDSKITWRYLSRMKDLRSSPESHGASRFREKTSLYRRWQAIKNRCNNPNDTSYKNYGGRGIDLCIKWQRFTSFREWSLNNGYKKKLSIDRIDNDLGYSPDNCRWVGRYTQNNNKRQKSRQLTVRGETKCMRVWAKEMGHPGTQIIRRRLSVGWDEERAVLYPVYKQGEAPKASRNRPSY